MPDVLVIGGGPAGSLASLLLSRGGCRVTLVEQSRFPRDKVCGECLSALGVAVLRRAGVLPALLERGATWLRRAVLHGIRGPTLNVDLPKPMLGVSRGLLDLTLLTAARDAGATLLQPCRCERIEFADRPVASIRDLVGNSIRRIEADLVLLADGKSALLGPRPRPTGDLGLKTHFALSQQAGHGPGDHSCIELFGFEGHYGGLAPIEGHRWNFAISVPVERMKSVAGDGDALLDELRSACPALRHRLEGARRVAPWLASPLPRFHVLKDWPNRVVPVGNAAAAIEPVGGEGMGLALRSAEMAVEGVARGLDRLDARSLRRQFVLLWRRRAMACRAAARLLSSPTLSRTALGLAGRCPSMISLAVSAMGKGDAG